MNYQIDTKSYETDVISRAILAQAEILHGYILDTNRQDDLEYNKEELEVINTIYKGLNGITATEVLEEEVANYLLDC